MSGKRWWRRGVLYGAAGFVAFMMVPETTITDWLGITSLQRRVVNLNNALFWEARGRFLASSRIDVEPRSEYGQLLGMMQNGEVSINVIDGSQIERKEYRLAGVELRDVYRAAVTLGALRDTTVRLDVYPYLDELDGESVVIWIHTMPVNLALIEDGYAIPRTPPYTTIMDQVYAGHYWRLVRYGKGNELDQDI